MEFDAEKHRKYFLTCLQLLPAPYAESESNRMTFLYFCLNGLAILQKLELLDEEKNDIIDWIYSLQITTQSNEPGGFRGSTWMGNPFNASGSPALNEIDLGNLAMTYTALASLHLLGDGLSRLNRNGINNLIKTLQQDDGSFCNYEDGESDMRFVYCVSIICNLQNDWCAVDTVKTSQFILKCQRYDGGFSQRPHQESHGGSTYCAIASLKLMNMLHLVDREKVIKWCLQRQISGFQGRPNKDADTCYSFWIGSVLHILNAEDYIDKDKNRSFLLSCQSKYGGICKCNGAYPDLLHSCLGLAALSLNNEEGLQKIDPSFGFPTGAKNAKSKRALEEREPKAVENPKVTMLLRNSTANQVVTDILGDLASLKKPLCKFFKRKDTFRPFEEDSKIEFLCQKNDASLFAIGQHTKKRPNTITMGRMFDFHILDMFELSVDKYVPMEHCKMAVGSKPLMIFNGEEFEQKPDFKKLQNFLLDYFSGIKVNAINLAGLEVLISVTALNGKIYFRVYNIALKKSGSRLPKVELKSTGPSLDLVLGRVKEASQDVMKMALKRPAELKPKKIKNISHNPLGDKLGRVHVGKQDLTKLQTRKMKGLKRTLSEKKAEKRQKTETQD